MGFFFLPFFSEWRDASSIFIYVTGKILHSIPLIVQLIKDKASTEFYC